MLNLPNTTAVSWTTPPTSSSVGPVTAVQRVSPSGDERQAGPGLGRDEQPGARPKVQARAAAPTTSPDEQAVAPLLPRQKQKDLAATERGRQASAQQLEQQRAAKELAEQEADKALREKLQAVLTTVWQASAAVVERALGREPANEVLGARSVASNDRSETGSMLAVRKPLPPEPLPTQQVDPLPWPIMQGGKSGEPGLSGFMPIAPEDIVGYDEKGNSSAAPLEVGSLVDRRV